MYHTFCNSLLWGSWVVLEPKSASALHTAISVFRTAPSLKSRQAGWKEELS